jgi:hypothetical protein
VQSSGLVSIAGESSWLKLETEFVHTIELVQKCQRLKLFRVFTPKDWARINQRTSVCILAKSDVVSVQLHAHKVRVCRNNKDKVITGNSRRQPNSRLANGILFPRLDAETLLADNPIILLGLGKVM